MKNGRVHIGKMIEEVMFRQGLSAPVLGRKMGVSKPTVYRILKEQVVMTKHMISAGKILNHDFFQYLPERDEHLKLNAILREENERLQKRNAELEKLAATNAEMIEHLRKEIVLLEQLNRLLNK
jgi:uncharacterized protein YaaN involved in tellurite resistance